MSVAVCGEPPDLKRLKMLENSSLEVAVLPDNQHCGDVAHIQKAELAPRGSVLGCLGVQGRLELWKTADRELPPAAVDGCYRE